MAEISEIYGIYGIYGGEMTDMALFRDIGGYTVNLEMLTFVAWDNAPDNGTPSVTLHFAGGPSLRLEGKDFEVWSAHAEEWLMDQEIERQQVYVHLKSWPSAKGSYGTERLVVGTYPAD